MMAKGPPLFLAWGMKRELTTEEKRLKKEVEEATEISRRRRKKNLFNLKGLVAGFCERAILIQRFYHAQKTFFLPKCGWV